MEHTDSPQAKAIKEALWAFGQAQIDIYKDKPLKVSRIGINRPTWERLDRAARMWLREIRPDPYHYDPEFRSQTIADMVWLAMEGKHRVAKLRNFIAGGWLDLEVDVHLPDGTVELVYDLGAPSYKTAGHLVDITPLLAASEANERG